LRKPIGWQAPKPASAKRVQLRSPWETAVSSQPTQVRLTQWGFEGSAQSESVTQPTQAPVPPPAGLSQTKAGPNFTHSEVPSVSQGPQVSTAALQSGVGLGQSVVAALCVLRHCTQVPVRPPAVAQWRKPWLFWQASSPAAAEQGPQTLALHCGAEFKVQSADPLLERQSTHVPCAPVAAVSQ
jgi:hypothetical protein